MTPMQKYAQIINQIFGEGTTSFDIDRNYDNRILTALYRNNGEQKGFAYNFVSRLKRLKAMYTDHTEDLKPILDAVNSIASKNWSGAFAELSAFDHLNTEVISGEPFFLSPIKTKQILDASLSLAQNYGQKISDLDGFIDEYGVYFDVKCLKDNIEEILQGIYSEVFSYYRIKSLNIMHEYPSDSSYLEIQSKRNDLRIELQEALNIETKPKFIQSTIITGLSYRIIWTPGVNQTISCYCPFKHAQNLHSSIFKYTNKLLKDAPTVLVLTVFPWYNLKIGDFIDSNLYFYRSFARRVFCQYRYKPDFLSGWDDNYTGPETLYEVTRHISAIIFIEDKTLKSEADNATSTKCFTYLNPNAKNPIPISCISYLTSISNGMYDDFENDNY